MLNTKERIITEFKIFKNPTGEIRAVKKGWNWMAFFFSFGWAFLNGLVSLGVRLLALGIAVWAVLAAVSSGNVVNYLLLFEWATFALWFGSQGNRTVETNLIKSGFEFRGSVYAESYDRAVALFRSANVFFCSECGAPMSSGDEFCSACGASLDRDEGNRSGNSNKGQRKQRPDGSQPLDSTVGPESQKAKHYGHVLGLKGRVTILDIKRNYRDLVAKYHPDKVQHLGEELQRLAELKTKELNEAYEYFKSKYSFD